MNKVCKYIINLLIPIISALFGLFLLDKYNFLENIPFIPSEYAYDIGITIYFAIIDIIIDNIREFLERKISSCRSKIVVMLSNINTEPNLKSTPIVSFNNEHMAEFQINIQLDGKKKHYENKKIIINDIGFVTIQPTSKLPCISISENGDYVVDLYKLAGNGKLTNVIQTFRVVMSKNVSEGTRIVYTTPQLESKTMWIDYKCNGINIKMEE